MSSGLILNGGTAESFSIVAGPTRQHSTRVDYDSWQPEDLVATVQFLATLDERLPYVLGPAASPAPPESAKWHGDDEPSVGDAFMSADVETDEARPLLSLECESADADQDQEHSAPGVRVQTVAEEANACLTAVQTPCSTEERSIIRASNKPAHFKR